MAFDKNLFLFFVQSYEAVVFSFHCFSDMVRSLIRSNGFLSISEYDTLLSVASDGDLLSLVWFSQTRQIVVLFVPSDLEFLWLSPGFTLRQPWETCGVRDQSQR